LLALLCLTFALAGDARAQIKTPLPSPQPPAVPVLPDPVVEQGKLTTQPLSSAMLKAQWGQFGKDKGWSALLAKAQAEGFQRIEAASWGLKGQGTDAQGKTVDVLFCAFDFYSPSARGKKSFQTASLIWKQVGTQVYKAYIAFPKGVTDLEAAFASSKEWFAQPNGKVQLAHSWGKNFRKCINGGNHSVSVEVGNVKIKVKADCKSQCLSAVAVCGGAASILEVASGGLGTVPLIATFGICAGIACGQCFAMCALSAL
jgi:hypothetical protein